MDRSHSQLGMPATMSGTRGASRWTRGSESYRSVPCAAGSSVVGIAHGRAGLARVGRAVPCRLPGGLCRLRWHERLARSQRLGPTKGVDRVRLWGGSWNLVWFGWLARSGNACPPMALSPPANNNHRSAMAVASPSRGKWPSCRAQSCVFHACPREPYGHGNSSASPGIPSFLHDRGMWDPIRMSQEPIN